MHKRTPDLHRKLKEEKTTVRVNSQYMNKITIIVLGSLPGLHYN